MGWLTKLFRALFSDANVIAPGTFLRLNGFIGVVGVLTSVLLAVGVEPPRPLSATLTGIAALVLCAGTAIRAARPVTQNSVLAIHGATFTMLAMGFAWVSLRWALRGPPLSSFRYAPGVIFVPLTYGALQLATFGPWPQHSRPIRSVAMCVGAALELVLLIALIARASS